MKFFAKSALNTSAALGAVLLTATAMPVHTVSAASTDYQNYPGANCLPQEESYDIKRHPNGAMSNESNIYQIWECPIPRRADNPVYVEVRMVDNGDLSIPSGHATCSLKALGPDGNVMTTWNRTTPWNGPVGVSWGDGLTPINLGFAWGLSLRCKMPTEKSRINLYRVRYN